MIANTINTLFDGELRSPRGYGYKLLSHPDSDVWVWTLVRKRYRRRGRRGRC
jgi:hypothetical protein